MGKQVTRKPEVRRDLIEQAAFIAKDSLAAAERFLDAAEAAFELLAGMPELGTVCKFKNPQAAGIRVWPIKGFERHLIFYRPTEQGIDIVRVVHAARDIDAIFGAE